MVLPRSLVEYMKQDGYRVKAMVIDCGSRTWLQDEAETPAHRVLRSPLAP